MAERRMFAKTIIDSDAFLEMPQSTQLLYFHLSMRADDEGFINKPKTIMRMVGSKEDDMRVLISKKFIIPFESGVVVIKHWKIHNYIRGDRLNETKYTDEKSLLSMDENGAYTHCQSSDSQLSGTCPTEVRLGKDRLGKDRLGKGRKEAVYFPNDEKLNQTFLDFMEMRKSIKAKMTEQAITLMVNKINKLDNDTAIAMLEQSIENSWKGIFPLKENKKPKDYKKVLEDWGNE